MYTVRLPFSGRQTTREYVISYTRMTVTLTLILNFDLYSEDVPALHIKKNFLDQGF